MWRARSNPLLPIGKFSFTPMRSAPKDDTATPKRRRIFSKRTFSSTKKVRSLLQTTHQIYFDWTYVYAGSAPFIFCYYYNIPFTQSQSDPARPRKNGFIV